MKYRKTLVALSVALGGLLAAPASATTFSFENLTNNIAGDVAIGEAQLFVDVTAFGASQVNFRFYNIGPAASSIADVYFDDGSLLGIAMVIDGPGVDFEQGANPGNLPSGNTATPPFVATTGFTADSEPPAQPNGVNPGEELTIRFDLQAGKTFADVLADLGDGDLRIGIHVQGFATGGSESFINNGPRVPEPGSLLLLGLGLAGLALLRRRRV